ncbi:hypothetical protein ABZ477_05120 [Microbacterium sp. NPDC019599]|uniref:hypothetical protein n=1 Tax=Microbacterium sp. NPDC019599 TaxID=3154690 RepID=UPI0033CF389C
MSPLADLHVDPPHATAARPALSDERRRHWLVPTAVLAAVSVGTFVLAFVLNPPIAVTGIVLVTTFYVAMLVCAVAARNVHNRTLAFAWLTGAISVTSVVLMLFVLAVEAIS